MDFSGVTLAALLGVSVYVIMAVIVARTARDRGHSYALFFGLSLIFSPIFAVFALAMVPYRASDGKYTIPRKYGEEPKATGEQKSTLRKLGVTDEGLLGSLGTRQAGGIINQLQTRFSMDWGTFLTALIVCPFAIYLVHNFFAHYQGHLPNRFTTGLPELHWGATPTPPADPATPATVARFATGPIVVIRPIVVAARYGQVTIPVGTQITVLAANQGRLTIRYAGETYVVPAASTSYPQ